MKNNEQYKKQIKIEKLKKLKQEIIRVKIKNKNLKIN